MRKMLAVDVERRLTMKECLEHHFFEEAFSVPKSPMLKFVRKPLQTLPMYRSHLTFTY